MFFVTLSKRDTSVTQIIKDLINVDLSKLFFFHLFSGPASVGISYSNLEKDRKLPLPITSQPLKTVGRLPEGLSLTFAMKLPKCGTDVICKFLQLIIGHKGLVFEIEDVGKRPEFAIDAPVGGGKPIKIGGLTIHDIRVGVVLSHGPPKVGLTHAELDIKVKNTTLKFIGDLEIAADGEVDMKFQMIGMWRKAFFLPFLAIGNVIAHARIPTECPECPTALELGGEMWLGHDCRYGDNKTTCIMGRGYFGIDEEFPDKNYFFFSVNQFSYSEVLVALGAKRQPWMDILDFWKMKDVQCSYSMIARDIPHGDSTQRIPAGIAMKGQISLLWFVDVHFQLRIRMLKKIPTGLQAHIWTNPVKIGKFFEMTSFNDTKTGPMINVNIGVIPPAFHVELSGRIAIPIFKMEAKVYGYLHLKGLTFEFSAKLLVFQVKVELFAAFKGKHHPNTFGGFRFRGEFDTGGKSSFLAKIKHTVQGLKSKADAALNKALAAVNKISQKMEGVIANKKAAAAVKRAREAAFKKAKEGVNKAARAVDHLCSVHCKKKCNIPKPCFKKKCHWGICLPIPGFCGTMCLPKSPLCLVKAAACLPVRLAAFGAKKLAIGVLNMANKALSIAQKAYMAAAKAFARYNPVVLAAKGLLHLAKLAVDGIAKLLLHFPLTIDRVWFDIDLGTSDGSFLEAGIQIHLHGKKEVHQIKINLKDIWKTILEMVKRFFAKIFGWLKKLHIKI